MKAYLDAMSRYFDFGGRSTRAQYWLYSLFAVILAVICMVIDGAINSGPPDGPGIATAIFVLAHVIPGLAVTVRRLHDIDRSGWWILISLVPLVGFIVMLVFACTASTPGANRFGAPRGGGAAPNAPAGGNSNGPALDQIEKLAALRNSGAIDDEEFKQMKAKAMGGPAS